MLNYPYTAPCPIGTIQDSQAYFRDDITEDLNYTTEFKAKLRNAGPRSRTSVGPRSQVVATASNVLAAPSATSTRIVGERGNSPISKSVGLGIAPSRRQASQLLTQRVDEESACEEGSLRSLVKSDVGYRWKRPRRRTIYVPPDDTTIPAVPLGKQSDNMVLSGHLSRAEHHTDAKLLARDVKTIEERCAQRCSPVAAPKRISLQPIIKPLQEMDDKHDSFVAGHGQENVPPGFSEASKHELRQDHISKARTVSVLRAVSKHPSKRQEPYHRQLCPAEVDRQTAKAVNGWKSQRRSGLSQITTLTQPALYRDRRASTLKKRNSLYYGTGWKAVSNLETCREQVATSNKSTVLTIRQSDVSAKFQYQVLEEDIEKPEMYEDAWLSHQESAIQQLLNILFEKAHEKSTGQQCDQQHFRRQLLRLYQDSHCALVYKRLQASLLYGALNPPKGSIADTNRLKTDIGLRHKFLAIWLGTYDLEAMMSAAVVVVGRNIAASSSPPGSSLPRSHKDPLKERKTNVARFIESCLLRNEDAHEQSDRSNSMWCWRRTMLRCLMMVLLLDKAKEGGLWPKNLFQSSSKSKSSKEIVTRFLSLISPFLGDGTRPLAHLQYRVHHLQCPLSEFKYGIENLATDFRDGVRLTYLVELLLYLPQASTGFREDVMIVAMPSSEKLQSTHDQQTLRPLSQRLQLPCLTPAQKVYNVEIALSALGAVGGVIENIAEGVRAEDIVNGHREKTVALIWSLVGTYGLEVLINFEDVQREIYRLSKWAVKSKGHDSETEDEPEGALKGMAKHTHLLKQWAKASARRQGVQVSNLTTSFSDGRVFAAIMDEYQKYLPKVHLARRPGAAELEAKLKDIGCSNAFASIFTHHELGRVFDRNFTLAALVFICSRVLRATKRGRAAAAIFRAYQRAKCRRDIRQKRIALRLSHDCQSVYVTQNQMIGAVRVLQRHWRAYLEQKRYGRILPHHKILARKRAVQIHGETSHDTVDIWLL